MNTGAVLGKCILARVFADGCAIDRKEQGLLEKCLQRKFILHISHSAGGNFLLLL